MAEHGLMVDYEWCTGCHSCEVACKQHLNLPEGKFGIKIAEEKPWNIEGDLWEYKYVPIPTSLCDMCQDRINQGKAPACVVNCCARVMEFGTPEELMKMASEKGSKVAVFLP